jgi:hypothetical protein
MRLGRFLAPIKQRIGFIGREHGDLSVVANNITSKQMT